MSLPIDANFIKNLNIEIVMKAMNYLKDKAEIVIFVPSC